MHIVGIFAHRVGLLKLLFDDDFTLLKSHTFNIKIPGIPRYTKWSTKNWLLNVHLVLLPDVVEVDQPVPPLQGRELRGLLRSGLLSGTARPSLGLDLSCLTVGHRLRSFLGVHTEHQSSLTVRSEYGEILQSIITFLDGLGWR